MSRTRVYTILMTSAVMGVASVGAQDCARSPLLNQRAAVGAALSHSRGETGIGASLGGRVAGPVRLAGSYRATRMDDVDQLAHEGSVELSAPVSVAGFDLCPSSAIAYSHLATDRSTMRGHVVTTEERLGASVGHPLAIARATTLTPFVEPMLVHRRTSWESVDADWRISGAESARETQLWLGASLAMSRSAVVARIRPKLGSAPREVGLSIVTAFGGR